MQHEREMEIISKVVSDSPSGESIGTALLTAGREIPYMSGKEIDNIFEYMCSIEYYEENQIEENAVPYTLVKGREPVGEWMTDLKADVAHIRENLDGRIDSLIASINVENT